MLRTIYKLILWVKHIFYAEIRGQAKQYQREAHDDPQGHHLHSLDSPLVGRSITSRLWRFRGSSRRNFVAESQ